MAEDEGFEPPEACTSTVFKTAAFDHSASPPQKLFSKYKVFRSKRQRNLLDTSHIRN